MKRLEPLKQFVCDACGETIASPAQGWLEWRADADGHPEGFRIVHHVTASPRRPSGDCYYRQAERDGDLHLEGCVGPDGLVRLLSFLDAGRISRPEEIVDIARRLHVPLYEEARQYWNRAEEDGFFSGANEYSSYTQPVLSELLSKYRART